MSTQPPRFATSNLGYATTSASARLVSLLALARLQVVSLVVPSVFRLVLLAHAAVLQTPTASWLVALHEKTSQQKSPLVAHAASMNLFATHAMWISSRSLCHKKSLLPCQSQSCLQKNLLWQQLNRILIQHSTSQDAATSACWQAEQTQSASQTQKKQSTSLLSCVVLGIACRAKKAKSIRLKRRTTHAKRQKAQHVAVNLKTIAPASTTSSTVSTQWRLSSSSRKPSTQTDLA